MQRNRVDQIVPIAPEGPIVPSQVDTTTSVQDNAATEAHRQAQKLRDSRRDFERARLAINMGKPRTALTLLTTCLEAEPDHPEYLALYGYATALEGGDLDMALRACQLAVEARSYDASLHAQLGYVYNAKGLAVRAAECYEAALQRDPQNSMACEGLDALSKPRTGFSLRSLLRFLRR
jgi:tetratricopeptide (TPR) repeat protein